MPNTKDREYDRKDPGLPKWAQDFLNKLPMRPRGPRMSSLPDLPFEDDAIKAEHTLERAIDHAADALGQHSRILNQRGLSDSEYADWKRSGEHLRQALAELMKARSAMPRA